MDGDIYVDSFQVKVENAPPIVQLEASSVSITEGGTITCRGTITDPGADTWIVEVGFRDGSSLKINVGSNRTFSFSHVYSESGNYVIRVVVLDDDGGVGQCSQSVTVNSRPQIVKVSNDATLHSLTILDDFGLKLNPTFDPNCLSYTVAPSGMYIFTVKITAAEGATIKYTNGTHKDEVLPLDPATLSATFTVDFITDLEIVVTAKDDVTTRTYKFIRSDCP